MTIFLEIAKEYLINDVTKLSDASVASDKSLSNTMFSMIGLGRDESLSKCKRELADILRTKIRTLESLESDEKNFAALNSFLSDCRDKAKESSGEKGYNEGAFGPGMSHVSSLLKEIYDRFKAANLLDIAYEKDTDGPRPPLTVFQYWAGVYLACKVKESCASQSPIKTLTHNPKVTSFYKLEKEKQDAVIKTIRECHQDLKTIKEDLDNYVEVCTKRVLESLQSLNRQNSELVEKYGTNIELPVTLSLFATATVSGPIIGPNAGKLEKCIKKAMKELHSKQDKEALNSGIRLQNLTT